MTPRSALVKDYMTGKLVTFHPDTDVLDAIHELVTHGIAGAPVTNNRGELIGMLSELDCMKVALHAGYHGHWGGPVSDYMTTDTETVEADMSIIDLAQRFIGVSEVDGVSEALAGPLRDALIDLVAILGELLGSEPSDGGE